MVRIARLIWRESVVAKLGSKHGVSINDVEDVCWDRRTRLAWVYDHMRGNRLFADGQTEQGRRLRVVLGPTDEDGVFRVITAFAD